MASLVSGVLRLSSSQGLSGDLRVFFAPGFLKKFVDQLQYFVKYEACADDGQKTTHYGTMALHFKLNDTLGKPGAEELLG